MLFYGKLAVERVSLLNLCSFIVMCAIIVIVMRVDDSLISGVIGALYFLSALWLHCL